MEPAGTPEKSAIQVGAGACNNLRSLWCGEETEETDSGWPAGFGPFTFWAPCFPCVSGILYVSSCSSFFPKKPSMEKEAKTEEWSCLLWAIFDEQCRPFSKCVHKTSDFCTFHIETIHLLMTPIGAPQPHMSQIPSVCKHFHNENGPVRTGALCHREDGSSKSA